MMMMTASLASIHCDIFHVLQFVCYSFLSFFLFIIMIELLKYILLGLEDGSKNSNNCLKPINWSYMVVQLCEWIQRRKELFTRERQWLKLLIITIHNTKEEESKIPPQNQRRKRKKAEKQCVVFIAHLCTTRLN